MFARWLVANQVTLIERVKVMLVKKLCLVMRETLGCHLSSNHLTGVEYQLASRAVQASSPDAHDNPSWSEAQVETDDNLRAYSVRSQ